MIHDKQVLRQQYLHQRLQVTDGEALVASQAVADHLASLIAPHLIVAGYAAIRNEMDVFPALTRFSALGCTLCLPVVDAEAKPLMFRQWKQGSALEKGHYGIRIPSANAAFIVPDVVLVPLVAFDRKGHRLGYGAGYYDRTLSHLRLLRSHLQAIGVAYSFQESLHIPAGAHDEALDIIVTEKGVLLPEK